MSLHELSSAPGSSLKAHQKGRSHGSSNDKTTDHGQKGQRARSGGGVRVGFGGGQMSLTHRIPKRGFHSISVKPLEAVNVSALGKFENGVTVSMRDLLEKDIFSECEYGYKVLGNSTLTKKLTVRTSTFSVSAKEKTIAVGGKYGVV